MVVALHLPQSAFLSSPLRETSHGAVELWQVRLGLQVFTHTYSHTLGSGPKSNKMDIAPVQQPKRRKEKEREKAELSWNERKKHLS